MQRQKKMKKPAGIVWSRHWPTIRLLGVMAMAVLMAYWHYRPRIDVVAARQALRDSELDEAIAGAEHPIERLHWQARKEHEHLLRRQSKTYIEAKEAYRRRYGWTEPWAYSAWYRLAKAWHSHVIDEYDDIAEQLAPFRNYFAHNCDQQIYDRAFLERWHILQVCFRHKDVEFYGYQEEWFVAAIKYLVEEFKPWAPNVCVLINVDDEPRVLLPPKEENAAGSNYASPMSKDECPAPLFDDQSRRSIWPKVSQVCPAAQPNQDDSHVLAANFGEFGDLCRAGPGFPYGVMHSPDNMRMTRDAVPIMSTARMTPFGDVLFPSPWRLTEKPQYYERDDVDWYIKLPYIYWRGSSTGGYATEKQWNFHRQSLVQHLVTRHAENVNIKFTDIIQCEPRACEIQNQTLPLAERQRLANGWEYKMVLDIDGNGASGRLYDLLLSRSLVLRHSFMREWHDQHLRPWLHYVPLPADYAQVDQVVEYFTSAQGDRVGKMIADEGRRWANESLRVHEMKLYFIRLVLEMGKDKRPPTW